MATITEMATALAKRAFDQCTAEDPAGPVAGGERVVRGGHWAGTLNDCRSARRASFKPNTASDAIGFRLVQIESSFDPRAKSRVGAIGYTQLMPATARFFMPDIDETLLYDRDINLRVGFRFLHQLMNRFDNNLHYALLAYNRGPTTVREILAQGGNPANGYAEKVVGK